MKKQAIVLIVSNHSLLGDILEELLLGNNSLLVHRTTPGLYQKMLQGTEWPDSLVVVMEKESLECSPSEMMRDASRVGRLHLIVVSSENDEVVVYTNDCAYPVNRFKLTSAASLVMVVNNIVSQSPERPDWFTAVPASPSRLTFLP